MAYIHTYTYLDANINMQIYRYMGIAKICVLMYIHKHIYAHVCLYMNTHAKIHMHIYMYAYVTHLCIYILTYIHMSAYIHT